MTNSVLGIFSEDPELAQAACKALAKQTNRDDLGFYHTIFQGRHVTVVEPALYPKKIQPLVFTALLADCSVVVARQPSQYLGEIIVLLDLLQKNKGFLVSQTDFSLFVKGTVLEDYECFASMDDAKPKILGFEPETREGALSAWVDHAFEVKGVGSVALGVVKRGGFKKHDKLFAFPGKKTVEIKSIQENDVDVLEAKQGDRFGICFKAASVDDLRQSVMLANDANESKDLSVTVCSTPFLKQSVPQKTLHLINGLQCVPCKLDAEVPVGKTFTALLSLEKPIAFSEKDEAVLVDLDARGLRVVAKAVLGG